MTERSPNRRTGAKKRPGPPLFKIMVALLGVLLLASVAFLMSYHPQTVTAPAPLSFEQKMAHLQAGTPLVTPKAPLIIPRWLWALVLGFAVFQLLALVVAAYRARAEGLTDRDLRQIEFLVETPMFLGLLGSLVGICMMQFISGSLAAPIAYLTSITGIVIYIFGRFTILESLPTVSDLS